jgi:hypothetical protein
VAKERTGRAWGDGLSLHIKTSEQLEEIENQSGRVRAVLKETSGGRGRKAR